MNEHDDAMWDKAVDAAGATEQRLRAAEHLLREVTPSQLSAATIDTMVLAVTREATPRTRCYGRLLAATMMLVIGLGAAAWRGTQAFWPETSSVFHGVQPAITAAMSATVEARRAGAVASLDEHCWRAIELLEAAEKHGGPALATAARSSITRLRSVLAGALAPTWTSGDFERACEDSTDSRLEPQARAAALSCVGDWAICALRAMMAAPLAGQAAGLEREQYVEAIGNWAKSTR